MTALPLLVDSHCHLNMVDKRGVPMEDAVARAKAAGVGIMQTICTGMAEAQEVISIAERFEGVYASVGIHPHEVKDVLGDACSVLGNPTRTLNTEHRTLETLLQYAQHPKVIGIGETGLDYYYEHSPRMQQQESFRVHIAASRVTQLPTIVHSRDADEDTVRILAEETAAGAFPFLIHCFSSTKYLAEKSIELGGYVSLSGIITFNKSQELRDIAKELPLNRLLVETDAPFLAPMPHRGKTCEPAFTRLTAECLAQLKGVSYEEVAKATTENFFRLFTKCHLERSEGSPAA